MHTVDNKTKEKIIALITVLIPDVHIYLFGSRARGTNSEYADIDIALDAGPLATRDVDEVKNILRESNIIYIIDVVDIFKVTPVMKEEILKDKVVWK
jgi:predicted nucleotidyltransferase